MQDVAYWNEWWTKRLAEKNSDFFPYFAAPMRRSRPGEPLQDAVNRDETLVALMRRLNLRSVLCAGNGVSQEPRGLAMAGLDVTALDLSAIATAAAEDFDCSAREVARFIVPQMWTPGGCLRFVVGDLMDPTICPGPFDVVIERRTIQRFPDDRRGAALDALVRRLSRAGIFVSHCNDDQFPPELGWAVNAPAGLFHASEAWLREAGWNICEGIPDPPIVGRTACLLRSGTMKPRPASSPGDVPAKIR